MLACALRQVKWQAAAPGYHDGHESNALLHAAATMHDRPDAADPLRELALALRRFADERDWDQFHAPKNLATALSVEAAELLEHFQWLGEAESRALPPATLAKVGDEMADVLLYLVRLADKLDVDLVKAAKRKMQLNARKYPIERARGTSRKYTEI